MEERFERRPGMRSLVREVNERMNALDRDAVGSDAVNGVRTFGFHCECGRDGRLRDDGVDDARGVRDRPTQDDRFALVPGHETERLEHVVDAKERFVIVDKVDEVEGLVADDPRGRDSGPT